MGLSAPKKRAKLSHDPNNSAWAKSTTGFGHKILAAQGWKPGDYLGAANASHADHYTAANASHIRVMLREDNLGLGAQIGSNNAETFGLSMFSSLLGRLNGKVEVQSEEQQKAQRDAVIRIKHEQKYGFLNFVSAGFLIGDKIEPRQDEQIPSAVQVKSRSTSKRKRDAVEPVSKSTTGDKAEDSSETDSSEADEESEPNTTDRRTAFADSSPMASNLMPKAKRQKKVEDVEHVLAKAEKKRAKAERRARKEERRKRRQERQERRARKALKSERKVPPAESSSVEQRIVAKPASEQRLGLNNGSRHATRQRYIQQKRMASMSSQALKEIFMIQATS